ncbi:MAG: hypothetical protein OXR03_20845, partial [Rhodospirillaceae bacterium]|nr:hypothetical protein [Rhodospirillaceae bacterium]
LPMSINIALFGSVGFFSGVTHASRDILVRMAATEGATGKVFGFVYSGLDLGGALAPLLFGWLMDGGQHRAVFLAGAVMYLLCVASVMQLRGGRVPVAAAGN